MDGTASYNAIGVPYVQNHQACPNADGSLDLYIQVEAPSDPKHFCNWLETPLPDGSNATTSKFILFLRMYWPDNAVLRSIYGWYPPPISSGTKEERSFVRSVDGAAALRLKTYFAGANKAVLSKPSGFTNRIGAG